MCCRTRAGAVRRVVALGHGLHARLLLDGGITLGKVLLLLDAHGVGAREEGAGKRESLSRSLGAQGGLGVSGAGRGRAGSGSGRGLGVSSGGGRLGFWLGVPWELGQLHLRELALPFLLFESAC